nr:MAG TPA: hypothetical protein [Caudoviricetes sp.]
MSFDTRYPITRSTITRFLISIRRIPTDDVLISKSLLF